MKIIDDFEKLVQTGKAWISVSDAITVNCTQSEYNFMLDMGKQFEWKDVYNRPMMMRIARASDVIHCRNYPDCARSYIKTHLYYENGKRLLRFKLEKKYLTLTKSLVNLYNQGNHLPVEAVQVFSLS